MSPARLVPALCLLAIAAWPTGAGAQIRRCVMPDGNVVHTDHSCSSLGAVEQARGDRGKPAATRVYHGGCARTLPDLVYEVTSAIDGRDLNRLAAAYHWPGLSGGAANATMDRIDEIASRPLLDVRLVTADVPAGPDPDDPFAIPEVDVRPTGLRIEQVRPDGDARVTTALSLRRHLECWWVQL